MSKKLLIAIAALTLCASTANAQRNWGDLPIDDGVKYRTFDTFDLDGELITIGGTAGIEFYEDNNLTPITDAETFTLDRFGTGQHVIAIDTDNAAFEAGKHYSAKLVAGATIAGVPQGGVEVAEFTVGAYATTEDITGDTSWLDNTLDPIKDDLFDLMHDIGANGSGLTALPWNASWDAEVQSEADDALVANRLDHLLLQAVSGTDVTDNSVIAKMVSKSGTADWDSFNNTTDSLEAIRDNGGGSMAWADLVADNDDVPGSFGKAIADILVDTGTSIPDAIDDLDTATTYPPRINFPPSPGFTTQVSRRADGTYKCTKPIRLTAGDVENVYVFIDMSPLFGQTDFVEVVGDADFSAGSVVQGDDNGPRDTYAVVELSGTADDDCEVTVPVTMSSGTTVDVVFDVEVLGG